MVEPFIGIDFGTSKSAMAWYDPRSGQAKVIKNAEGAEKTPSVVYLGDDETLVGNPAEAMLEFEAERRRVVVSVKRSLVNSPVLSVAGRHVSSVDVAAEILGKLRRDADDLHFHQQVKKAVITCPAAFGPLQRDEIEKAGRQAGFDTIAMLDEPSAAALAYAHEGVDVGNVLLVYDLGAGTFDVAVLARESDAFRIAVEPRGMARCGGDDFDQALYDYSDRMAQTELGRHITLTGELDLKFLHLCRQRKENLTSRDKVTFSSRLTSGGAPIRFKQTIERTTLEGLIGKYIESTARLTKDILDEARSMGYPVDTVILIGGSSSVPMVERLLTTALPVEPQKWQQKDMAVALGAAYHAHTLWGQPPAKEPPSESRDLYRLAVQMAWADKVVSPAEIEQLHQLAQQYGLSADEAAAVEREVMGDVNASQFGGYGGAAATSWPATTAESSPVATQSPAVAAGAAGEMQLTQNKEAGGNGRSYAVTSPDLPALGEDMRQFLDLSGYETQVVVQSDGIVVQGKKVGWRSLVGMGQAATMVLQPTDGGFTVSVGGGKWLEQGAGIAVGLLVFWPLLVTGGVGMWQQKDLMDKLWRVVDNHVNARGGRRIQ